MNNITTIDGHVLLPHYANWAQSPNPSRVWLSEVTTSLSGKEDRSSVRANPWKTLRYQILPYNNIEQARFNHRVRAALKAGKVAVPHWGRGVALDSRIDIGDETIYLDRSHNISDGEHILIQSPEPSTFDTWDLCVVVGVNGRQLTLSAAVTNAYSSGDRVWPLLFGRPILNDFRSVNLNRSRTDVDLQFDQRQVKPLSYDNFEDSELGVAYTPPNGGEGWASAWVLGAFI